MTEAPPCACPEDRGGLTVHPVPAPFLTTLLTNKRVKAQDNSQNLILFIRGKAISGASNINGTSQFPNPPIMIGLTIRKIITIAWAVTITLYIWSSQIKASGWTSSVRTRILKDVPTISAHAPKMKYKVPISFWFAKKNYSHD